MRKVPGIIVTRIGSKRGIVVRKCAVGAAAAAPWRRGGFVQAGRRAAVHSGVLLTCLDLPPRCSAVT